MSDLDYILGLDLGQAADPTALAILERRAVPQRRAVRPPPMFRRAPPPPTENHFAVRYLRRWPLGTSYVQIVEDVANLVSREQRGQAPLKGSLLAVDRTGVGRPVVDMIRQRRMQVQLVPVTITAGAKVTWDAGLGFNTPKKELVTCLQVLLQSRRLKIARELPEVETLTAELHNFRVKVTEHANEQFLADWRTGQHDDLVLAVAVAAWVGERLPRPAETFRPYVLGYKPLDAPA